MRKQKAITLISLVITIVVLIILSSVAIYLSLGNNGIFVRSKQAKEATNKQTATEIINLKITNCQMNKYAEKQEMPTLQELADILYEDNEIEYIALETKVGSKEKITVGSKTSIFTKLNQYPYEFEINSSLQLASINGVKIANTSTATIDDELLDEPIIEKTLNKYVNNDYTIKSIEGYKYLLFTYGSYDPSVEKIWSMSTTLIPISQVIYGTDGPHIELSNAIGANYTSAEIKIMDKNIIRFEIAVGSNSGRSHFALVSIKGIK